MNCIFCCIFNQEKYIDMFFLLLESIFKYGNLNNNIQILIYTSSSFMQIIKKNILSNNEKIVYEINDEYNNIDKACKARLDVFDLVSIKNYNKILYLDTDIIIKDDINKVFDVCKEDILYVLEEGSIDCNKDFWGKLLFGNKIKNYKDKSAFTSGILLFNNCEKIKYLFLKIKKLILKKPYNFSCYDQPYIVYKAFKYNLYNNKILKEFAVNNEYNINSDKIIHHFPETPGFFVNKILFLKNFLNQLNKNIKYRNYDLIYSDKFYFDIYNFFKDKGYFKIVELMLNNNQSTKILANIFSKVYSIQQKNIENYNNIEYIDLDLDLFKINCNIVAENIDIIYISCRDSYNECKNYILNCIKIFKNLKYIIIKNYGIYENIKKNVDEFIEKNIIILENFERTSNPNEGIICSINKNFNNNLINKTYKLGNSSITFLDNNKINSFEEGNFIFTGKNKINAYLGSNIYNITFNDNFSELVFNTEDNFENITSKLIFDSSHIINNIYEWDKIKIKFINNLKFYLNDDNKEYNYSIKDDLIIYSKINGIKYLLKFNQDYSDFVAKNKEDNSISKGKLIFHNILINKIYTWNKLKIKFLDNFKIHIFDIYNVEGKYIFESKYRINLIINGDKYILEFNNDYYEFKSTRINDLYIVNEKLLFDTILVNKIFTWGNKYIKFLDNFKLITDKPGIYRFINKNNIIINLDKKEYNINFNNEYNEFSYIKKNNSNIIFEKIVNNPFIIDF